MTGRKTIQASVGVVPNKCLHIPTVCYLLGGINNPFSQVSLEAGDAMPSAHKGL